MHDFCFTYPYAGVMMVGGVMGYFMSGSTKSLMGGLGSGALLGLAGYLQLKAFEKRTNFFPAILLQLVVSLVLSFVMGKRALDTGKIFPPGIVAAISFTMFMFYLIKASSGGNHFKKVAETKKTN